MKTLSNDELLEQKILLSDLIIEGLEIEVKRLKNKIMDLTDEIIVLEVKNTQLKRIIKEMEK